VAAYKRSIILINPGFQFKVSFMVFGMVIISSILYPWSIIQMVESFVQSHPEALPRLEERRNQILMYLGTYHLIYGSLIFGFMLFLTHRVAGPIYKLTTMMKKVREGARPTRVDFRSGDYFHDLAFETTKLFEYLDENRKNDMATVEEINNYIKNLSVVVPEDKRPVLLEITKKLTEIKERFNANT
jgi:hypothetical protein